MWVLIVTFSNLSAPSIMSFLTNSKSPLISKKLFISYSFSTAQRGWDREVSHFREIPRTNLRPWRTKNKAIVISAAEGLNCNNFTAQRRSSDKENTSYIHTIFMRFQTEDLIRFYDNPNYVGASYKSTCFLTAMYALTSVRQDILNVDYESEVEDDILPIFRKGEEFNYGVGFLLLMVLSKKSLGGQAEEAMTAVAKLSTEFPSLIVQSTEGSNFNLNSSDYTHAIEVRFRSSEAFEMFTESSAYNNIWQSKIQPITEKALSLHFSVDPAGTELM